MIGSLGSDDVEVHRAVVGVDGDLDAVPDVVDRLAREARLTPQLRGVEGGRVRELVAHRVGVLDVDQPAVVDDDVGVLVEAQERGDHAQPVGQRPVEQQLAVRGDLVGDQQVEITEPQREQQPVDHRVERDPVGPRPARRRVRVAGARIARVVELGLARANHDIVVVALAEVDAGLGDLGHAGRRDRRQVTDPELGLPFGGDLVDRDHGNADAVRVDDPLVDPAVRVRVLGDRQLAGREHHLAQRAVDDVAIGVDVVEVVVLADGLQLVERGLQRPVVPQPGVGERVGLARRSPPGSAEHPPRTVSSSHWSSPKASRVIAMLLAMYGCSWAYVLGSTLNRWIASGYSRPSTIEATNQTTRIRPSGHIQRVNAPATRSAPARPDRNVSTS